MWISSVVSSSIVGVSSSFIGASSVGSLPSSLVGVVPSSPLFTSSCVLALSPGIFDDVSLIGAVSSVAKLIVETIIIIAISKTTIFDLFFNIFFSSSYVYFYILNNITYLKICQWKIKILEIIH